MYCSTVPIACQGLFSVIFKEVLSQPTNISGVYWTIPFIYYACKRKKKERYNVHSDRYRFYMGYEADLSADGDYATGVSVPGGNMFVGIAFPPILVCKIIFEHIFDLYVDKYAFVY